ncbi:Golgi-associated plant pathogenesis-related protein 1-like [Mytilus galloprovincialis]|uniref:Golgi-associated plant pathogenesis-related protein 1-like n=1 Tax=Mytilus galloprovincialis TaxID=29158 RepID=UPI003F7BE099
MGCGSSSAADAPKSETETQQTTTTASPKNAESQPKAASDKQPEAKSAKQENSNDTESSFIDDAVKAHNEFRDMHGSPHITHAQDLTDYSQKWAEHLANTGKFDHSKCDLKGESIGENLAMMGGSGLSNKRAREYVKMWYDEIKDYHYYGSNPDMDQFMKFGHFTQLVWKEAKQIGVGMAIAKGQCVVVCNYRPAGNMMGDFADNVPKAL